MTTSDSRWDQSAMVERMSSDFGRRYPLAFWEFFESQVRPRTGDAPAIADLGCGAGLLLQELSSRLPDATLRGSRRIQGDARERQGTRLRHRPRRRSRCTI